MCLPARKYRHENIGTKRCGSSVEIIYNYQFKSLTCQAGLGERAINNFHYTRVDTQTDQFKYSSVSSLDTGANLARWQFVIPRALQTWPLLHLPKLKSMIHIKQ